jgi:hypothetical protein
MNFAIIIVFVTLGNVCCLSDHRLCMSQTSRSEQQRAGVPTQLCLEVLTWRRIAVARRPIGDADGKSLLGVAPS